LTKLLDMYGLRKKILLMSKMKDLISMQWLVHWNLL
jgi:hypothetical protein